jgi:hypothetical protein
VRAHESHRVVDFAREVLRRDLKARVLRTGLQPIAVPGEEAGEIGWCQASCPLGELGTRRLAPGSGRRGDGEEKCGGEGRG